MAKKYDTNPLDPEFPEKVKETKTATLPTSNIMSGKTRKFADVADTEEQTRKFGENEFNSYSSTFGQNHTQPTSYQTAHLYEDPTKKASSRKVEKIGLPENILMALPYIPFSILGLIAGFVELLIVPKTEPKVRFHAAQGVAANLGIILVTTILGFASIVTDLASMASFIFWIVTTIMLIVFAVKAWKGEPVHIASVEDLTNWLEEKIKPQLK